MTNLQGLRRCWPRALVACVLVGLGACGGDGSSPTTPPPPAATPPPPPAGVRDLLTVDDLFGGAAPGVVHNSYFTPLGGVLPTSHRLCGTLHFAETPMATTHPDSGWMGSGQTLFPAFSLPVVTVDDWLIPLERDLILSGRGAGGSGRSLWNIIANPGHVWEEPGDGGLSRATLLLTFTDNYVGQARNALATFVFSESEVSSAAVQITQETAPNDEYLRTDFSALVPLTLESDCPAGAEGAIAAFGRERASRLPLRQWSDLPDAGSSYSVSRNGFADTDVSALALLMDGQLYQQTVATRSGPHPWPQWMRHGVFSVTKTLGLGLSMFYLAHRYGDAIFEEQIVDYVPELADHPGWHGVTFHHALNMVTGTAGGERGAAIGPFIQARSAASKIAAIHAYPDAPPAPGTEFTYYSTHSFVLSQAMNNYVRVREGPNADYWTMVSEDVLEPIGVPHLPLSRSFENDGRLGTPIMGWGSYPDVDAAAKVAQLLQDEGVFQRRQLLSRAKVREALRRAGRDDYPTGNSAERYLHSVWTVRTDVGSCTIDVPTMSGDGGNHVMMLPSGLSVVRFMDADDYEVSYATRAAEMYRSSCR
ncbi:MAG: hypothetical protein LJF15_12615 [Acidobacteria bacterium]|nr:hypothetical protein [Acidobacteriota bacterium]